MMLVRETYDLVEALGGFKILKEVRVGDLTGCPFALVRRIINHGGIPLALVVRIGLVGTANRGQLTESLAMTNY
jgi:hypothetical protein